MIDGFKEYMQEIGFEQYIDKRKEVLVNNNMYKEDKLRDYEEFANEFWQIEGRGVSDLKGKYSIPNSIGFEKVVRSFPTPQYLEFLNDVFNGRELADLVSKYNLHESYIKKLMSEDKLEGICYLKKDKYCPDCLENEFEIVFLSPSYYEPVNLRYNRLRFQCENCNEIVDDLNNFISQDKIEELKSKLDFQKSFIEVEIKNAKKELENKYCPNCQSGLLEVEKWNKPRNGELGYDINCKDCFNEWKDKDEFLNDYNEFQKRAAMMINIKEREEKIIEKLLDDSDDSNDINIKEEVIIKNHERESMIRNAINGQKDISSYWKKLYKTIRSLNKPQRNIFIEIIKELKEKPRETMTWHIGQNDKNKLELVIKNYGDIPVVSHFAEKTGMLNCRAIIRYLMSKNLIACSEEENTIQIDPIILRHQRKVLNAYEPQNIKKEIKMLVFKNHNYSCQNCGADDKPLKIAYLSFNKDVNNLNLMLPICNLCYPDVTKDEVLIDAAITMIDLEEKQDEFVSWQFLTTYLPTFKDDNEARNINLNLIDQYGEEGVIKSYAITLYKLIKDNTDEASKRQFINYAKAVLKNSEGEPNIYDSIVREYEVEEWLESI